MEVKKIQVCLYTYHRNIYVQNCVAIVCCTLNFSFEALKFSVYKDELGNSMQH